MEMLSITNPTLPTDGGVVSGQRGEYTCQVCGTIFVLGGVGGQEACAQSTSILAIAGKFDKINLLVTHRKIYII